MARNARPDVTQEGGLGIRRAAISFALGAAMTLGGFAVPALAATTDGAANPAVAEEALEEGAGSTVTEPSAGADALAEGVGSEEALDNATADESVAGESEGQENAVLSTQGANNNHATITPNSGWNTFDYTAHDYDEIQFSVSKYSQTKITVQATFTYMRFSLYNKDGDGSMASEIGAGDNTETYSRTVYLAPGTYMVKVRRATTGTSHEGTYKIKVDTTNVPSINEVEPNDSVDSANAVAQNKKVYGLCHNKGINSKDYDYYKFTVPKSGKVQIWFNAHDWIKHDAGSTWPDFELTDGYKQIAFKRHSGGEGLGKQKSYSHEFELAPGTYYLNVNPCTGAAEGPYEFYWRLVHDPGWAVESGAWCYYNDNGDKVKGWHEDGGKWYYLDPLTGAMKKGWLKSGSSWYYLTSTGAMATSWAKVGSNWYLFGSSGKMLTGWQNYNGKWYYLNGSGAMLTGWQKISGYWYYFSSTGAMASGWGKVGSNWYLFGSGGKMLTGWQKVSGKWYYLDGSGVMLTGWQNIGGKWYQFNSNGVWIA